MGCIYGFIIIIITPPPPPPPPHLLVIETVKEKHHHPCHAVENGKDAIQREILFVFREHPHQHVREHQRHHDQVCALGELGARPLALVDTCVRREKIRRATDASYFWDCCRLVLYKITSDFM